MTNKKKAIWCTSVIFPTAVISAVALSSCSSTHPFIKPDPINLDSSINQVDSLLNTYNTKLDSMSNFNDVFKIQDELLTAFNSDSFNFNNNVVSVVVDITPQYTNSLLSYEYCYQINFKTGIDISFNSSSGYSFINNRLISPKHKLNNISLSNQTGTVCFWVSNANVIDSTSYISFDAYSNSFNFNYNNENFNVVKYKTLNTPLSTFSNIKVFINKVIANTYGKDWLTVTDDAKEISNSKSNIKLDISYRLTDGPISIPQTSLETNQYSFTISASQVTN